MKRKYLFLTILALAIAFVVIACANPGEDVQGNEVAASPSGNKTTVANTTPSVTTPLLTTPGTTPNIVPVTAPATTPNTTAGTALVTTPITTPVTTFGFGISLSIADPSLLSDPSIVHFIDDRSPSNDQHILVVANKPIKYFCFNEIIYNPNNDYYDNDTHMATLYYLQDFPTTPFIISTHINETLSDRAVRFTFVGDLELNSHRYVIDIAEDGTPYLKEYKPIITPVTTPTTTPVTTPVYRVSYEEVFEMGADDLIETVKKKGYCPDELLPQNPKDKTSDAMNSKLESFFKNDEVLAFIPNLSGGFASTDMLDICHIILALGDKTPSDEEIEALREMTGWWGLDTYTHTTSEIVELLKKYTNETEISDKMNKPWYLEKYDAYYAETGGVVGFLEVSHFNAWMLENGNILVCVYDTQEEEASVLVLQEKGDSFIFLQGFALV